MGDLGICRCFGIFLTEGRFGGLGKTTLGLGFFGKAARGRVALEAGLAEGGCRRAGMAGLRMFAGGP